jgi:D-sedoheptulose 7-phosphate isomerase
LKESTLNIIRNYFLIDHRNIFTTWGDVIGSIQLLVNCFINGNKLLICGNGGSAADANHIMGELIKDFKMKTHIIDVFKNKELEKIQHSLPVISLTNNSSVITAIVNDISPDLIFAQQVYGLGKKGDILLVISTSGNSKNILCACEIAQILGLTVIGLTGDDGGGMKEYCNILIKTNSKETSTIQELHVPIYHTICEAVENEIYGV